MYVYKKPLCPGSQTDLLICADIHKCLSCLQEVNSRHFLWTSEIPVPGVLCSVRLSLDGSGLQEQCCIFALSQTCVRILCPSVNTDVGRKFSVLLISDILYADSAWSGILAWMLLCMHTSWKQIEMAKKMLISKGLEGQVYQGEKSNLLRNLALLILPG